MKTKKTHVKSPLLGRVLLKVPPRKVFYPRYLAQELTRSELILSFETLPDAWDGFRFVFLSDVHYGDYFGQERVQNLADLINREQTELVIFGGDYGQNAAQSEVFFSALPDLTAKHVLIILGNHDRETDADPAPLVQKITERGFVPLINDRMLLEKDGATVALIGIDDFYHGTPDLEKAEKDAEGADFSIFLTHTPDVFPELKTYFFDLSLCGHTHGGQVALGGHAIKSSSLYGSRYLSGIKHEKDATILISNGVGTSLLPVRFGAPAQYHVITLKKT